MIVCSKHSRVTPLVFTASLFAMLQGARPAAAMHVNSVSVTVTSVNSVTRQVDIDITETTGPTSGPILGANIQWGDAASSGQPWTVNNPGLHQVSASHTYPDLTTRTITVTGDCCGQFSSSVVATAQVDFGCADTPLPGCRAAGKSLLLIKNDTADDSKDKLIWKWVKGADTSLGALGNPTSSTQYFVCIYAPGPVLQATIDAGVGWVPTGTTGYQYVDAGGAAGGVTLLKLKSGPNDKAKVVVKGKGAALDDPLPLTQPVTVQVQNNNGGECWEHAFTAPEIENSTDKFKDREP